MLLRAICGPRGVPERRPRLTRVKDLTSVLSDSSRRTLCGELRLVAVVICFSFCGDCAELVGREI